jgi:hypothetical protein
MLAQVEGDAEFGGCQRFASVESWAFLVNKCRMPEIFLLANLKLSRMA